MIAGVDWRSDDRHRFPSHPCLLGDREDSLTPDIPIGLVGASYHTADLHIRGHLGFAGPGLQRVLDRFTQEGFDECLVLSTCNRTEVYFVGGCREQAERILSEESGLNFDEILSHLYAKSGPSAALHLFAVASGLDSAVLGETEILAQIKDSVTTSRRANCMGRHLDFLVRRSQAASRRVRTETELCRNVTSIGSLAVKDATTRTRGFEGKVAVVVGAGKIAERIAKDLSPASPSRLIFVNRTLANAEGLAYRYGGEARPLCELEQCLSIAEIVFTAAASDTALLDSDAVNRVAQSRNGRNLTLIDLGVPSNIDHRAASAAGWDVLDMDDLSARCDRNSAKRMAAVPQAVEIMEEELDGYQTECTRRAASPTIEALVRFGDEVKEQNLQWATERLSHLSDKDLRVVADMANRMVKGFLQSPIRELKEELTAQEQRDLVLKLFHLESGDAKDR